MQTLWKRLAPVGSLLSMGTVRRSTTPCTRRLECVAYARTGLLFASLTLTFACSSAGSQRPTAPVNEGDAVELVFLDVGQGDAILIRSPEGKVALIDGGRNGVAEQLQRHDVNSIDLAVASHAHADHIGGMEEVILTFPVSYYMDNGLPHTTATYQALMNALQASDVIYLEASARTIELGSVLIRVLESPACGTDQNNCSIGLVIQFDEFKALLTGDSEVEEINHFLQVGVPDVVVLKAAHHGSRNGVTPAWLSATRPEVVVISCGLNNQYGHPDSWALQYYEATADHVYRTDWHGEVTIRGFSDGRYDVSSARVATFGHRNGAIVTPFQGVSTTAAATDE